MTSNNRPQNIIPNEVELSLPIASSLKFESDNVWFSTIQTANYLDISVNALLNMTSNGKIPYYKLGRRNRYKKLDLDHLLESNRKGPVYEY